MCQCHLLICPDNGDPNDKRDSPGMHTSCRGFAICDHLKLQLAARNRPLPATPGCFPEKLNLSRKNQSRLGTRTRRVTRKDAEALDGLVDLLLPQTALDTRFQTEALKENE